MNSPLSRALAPLFSLLTRHRACGVLAALLAAALPCHHGYAANDLAQQKLYGHWTNPTPTAYFFGASTALSAKYALVGTHNAYDTAAGQGSVQVYDAATGTWLRKILSPGNNPGGSGFGMSVAVSGNLAVVGAPGNPNTPGAAYIYDLATGVLKATLKASDGVNGDYLGYVVAIQGGLAAVSAPYHDNDKGAVYLFQVSDGTQVGKFQGSGAMAKDYFGTGMAMEGNILAVGAPGVANKTGAAYFFDLATQTQITKYTPGSAMAGDDVGSRVSLQGGRAALCTQFPSDGKVFMYNVADGSNFELYPSDPVNENYFGYNAVVDGNRVLVGCTGSTSIRGSVYVFDAATGDELRKFHALDAENDDGFGYSIAAFHSTVLVGKPYDNTQAKSCGAGYLVRNVTTPSPLTKVAAKGDFAPGALDCNYGTLGDGFINSDGEVGFSTALAGLGSHGGKDSAAMSDLFVQNTPQLVSKSGQSLGGGVTIGGVSGVIVNNPDVMLGRAKLAGTGVNGSNNQLLWWSTSSDFGTILRTGSTVMEFGNATLLNHNELVQSIRSSKKFMAVSCALKKNGGVNATNDTGIWAAQLGTSTEAVREGVTIPTTAIVNGQFSGRVAFQLDRYVYSEGLTGPAITTANNTAIVQKPYGMNESIVVQKGSTPAGIPAKMPKAPVFTGFLGEVSDGGENIVYRATIAGTGITAANNEGLWLDLMGVHKLQLRKGQPLAILPGVSVSKIINFWAVSPAARTLALVRLAGTGVKPANDQAIIAIDQNGVMQMLMREGEPAAGCTPATIGTISRVEVNTWYSNYAVLCTLAGAPAGTDQALFTGSIHRGNDAEKATLKRPFLRLRKGELYENQPSKIKSISLPTTNLTASGAGATGRGRAISWIGNLAIKVEFENKVCQIMRGTAE